MSGLCSAHLDKFVYIFNEVLVSIRMKFIVKLANVIKNAVFLEQTKNLLAIHLVFVFIKFKAKCLKSNNFWHKTIFLS